MNHTKNGFEAIEDWTPSSRKADHVVFWVCVVIALLALVW